MASLKVCIKERVLARAKVLGWQKNHLKRRLYQSKLHGDSESKIRIISILKQEARRNIWRLIKHVTSGDKGRSITFVEKEVAGDVVHHSDKDSVEKAILAEI